MSIREVAQMGNPVLCNIAKPIEHFNQSLKKLVQDIKDTMKVLNAVGITAPHIGIGLRIVIFGFETSSRYPDKASVPLTVLINPKMEILTEEKESGWEGSISLPNIRGKVPRYRKVKYTAFDEEGNPIEGILEDFAARILQHEIDQLNGIWFLQKIEDWTTCGFEKELNKASIYS